MTEIIPMINPWGTFHFSDTMMQRLIGIGKEVIENSEMKGFDRTQNIDELNITPWLCFVPIVYRAECKRIAVDLMITEFLHRKTDDETLMAFIRRLQERIIKEIEPESHHRQT